MIHSRPLSKKLPSRLTLLALGLALGLSVAAGCKPKETTPAAPGKATDAAASTGQPGTPGTLSAHTPAAGTPASAGGLAGVPGAAGADNAPLPPDKMPAVVAKVNGQPIKKNDLLDGGQVVQMRFAQMGQQIAPSSRFYHQVLNELVAIILRRSQRARGPSPTRRPTRRRSRRPGSPRRR
jgi:hypothetical protein